MPRAPIALTISSSDSSGGSGVQADVKTFSALGVYAATAITAVVAQDTLRTHRVVAMEPAFVAQQVDAVLSDIGADVVKTGWLVDAGIIEAVAARLAVVDDLTLVIDPMIVAKDGTRLLDEAGVTALRERLLPLATVVTPNVAEAEALTGRKLADWNDVREAAAEIAGLGAKSVVIMGGRREGRVVTDLLFDGREYRDLATDRVPTPSTMGTGAAFSAALAATLAKRESLPHSVASAKAYVTKALQEAYALGKGNGPPHHFYRYWRPLIE
jgi:hydroxymethylpyrimidine kinase/phosphomethylpyrimidine kinase